MLICKNACASVTSEKEGCPLSSCLSCAALSRAGDAILAQEGHAPACSRDTLKHTVGPRDTSLFLPQSSPVGMSSGKDRGLAGTEGNSRALYCPDFSLAHSPWSQFPGDILSLDSGPSLVSHYNIFPHFRFISPAAAWEKSQRITLKLRKI